MKLDFAPIDADNHYYEPLDAFTRHLDKKYATRGVQVVTDANGHTQLVIGGRVNRFIPNPTFDPIIVPGCLDLLFRGRSPTASTRAPCSRSSRSNTTPTTAIATTGSRWPSSRDSVARCSFRRWDAESRKR